MRLTRAPGNAFWLRAAPVDFVIQGEEAHGVPGLLNLFGIDSPGLTASLAIGEHVQRKGQAPEDQK